MEFQQFYTPLAESAKFIFYLFLAALIVVGIIKKRQSKDGWANWIHAAIYLNFLVGAIYSGLRMLSTDPVTNMYVRRIFALEAWFCFACASFYFLFLYLFSDRTPKSSP
jgi:predicted membrane channel-forming protein YqfA (hemolysin III family)